MPNTQTYLNDILFFEEGTLTYSVGRNGEIKTKGVDFFLWERNEDEFILDMAPITSKGVVGRGHIQIPASEIPALIETLQKFI